MSTEKDAFIRGLLRGAGKLVASLPFFAVGDSIANKLTLKKPEVVGRKYVPREDYLRLKAMNPKMAAACQDELEKLAIWPLLGQLAARAVPALLGAGRAVGGRMAASGVGRFMAASPRISAGLRWGAKQTAQGAGFTMGMNLLSPRKKAVEVLPEQPEHPDPNGMMRMLQQYRQAPGSRQSHY